MGILAHVDAGKTTLSEALLYKAGNLRNLGRVDNGDAFLDTNTLEKKRGITIFSHAAKLTTKDLDITLLDTPGHVDFASQTEETLGVLVDYAILVVSATDGVVSYTKALWRLLQRYNVPTYIFVNKTDIAGTDLKQVLADIQKNLDQGCIDFSKIDDNFYENIAAVDDDLLEKYLDGQAIEAADIQGVILQRQVFPVFFGSALKLTGIPEFLAGLDKWTKEKTFASDFKARCFKISHDQKGERLSWLRILGGNLKAKTMLNDEKINQLRSYNGAKFTVVPEAKAGDVVAATGLKNTYPGEGIGIQDTHAFFKPVLTYRVNPGEHDIHECLKALKVLEDENPQLHVTWLGHLQEIHVQVMGEIQLEILQQLLQEQFNLAIRFEQGNILYKETITKPIEAVGHFEPLRHYAEVHLLLEPGPANSGIVFENKCDLEVLTKNWQHQIMTALKSKEHLGVLTGSPITDMKITLIGGKGSLVHSVGGDFREATYRAIRQGLMELKVRDQLQLLEPWYDFYLEVEQDQVGRALNDIQRMHGKFDTPENNGNRTIINGSAPVSEMRDYATEVRNYTHGQGIFGCVVKGYLPCHNTDEVIAAKDYDPVSDLENTPNSVFCSHGAGHTVTWDQVPQTAHYPYTYPLS